MPKEFDRLTADCQYCGKLTKLALLDEHETDCEQRQSKNKVAELMQKPQKLQDTSNPEGLKPLNQPVNEKAIDSEAFDELFKKIE